MSEGGVRRRYRPNGGRVPGPSPWRAKDRTDRRSAGCASETVRRQRLLDASSRRTFEGFGEVRERVLDVAYVRLPERVEDGADVRDRAADHVDADVGDHP